MTTSWLVFPNNGWFSEKEIRGLFGEYDLHPVLELRRAMKRRYPGLKEKANTKGKYLGYSRPPRGDRVYFQFQTQCVNIDLAVPRSEAGKLAKVGVITKRRESWQAQAKWLTGAKVPYGCSRTQLRVVTRLVLEAFTK